MRAIEKALNKKEAKVETVYVLNRKGGKTQLGKKPKGGKVKYVDKRMKNDVKAIKGAAAGKRKHAGMGKKQSKSKKRR